MHSPALKFADIQLGIIDNDMLQSILSNGDNIEYIDDFTSEEWKGWRLYFYGALWSPLERGNGQEGKASGDDKITI